MARAYIVSKRRDFIKKYIKGFKPISTKEVHRACVENRIASVEDNIKGYHVTAKDIEYLKKNSEISPGDICYPKVTVKHTHTGSQGRF